MEVGILGTFLVSTWTPKLTAALAVSLVVQYVALRVVRNGISTYSRQGNRNEARKGSNQDSRLDEERDNLPAGQRKCRTPEIYLDEGEGIK